MRTFWVPKRQLRESKPLIHYASDWDKVIPAADVQALVEALDAATDLLCVPESNQDEAWSKKFTELSELAIKWKQALGQEDHGPDTSN